MDQSVSGIFEWCGNGSHDVGPHQFLQILRNIERAAGRQRFVANGPRTLDLDFLLAADGRTVISTPLIVPHPRLHQRAFVLQPLAEIASAWPLPVPGKPRSWTVAAAWHKLQQLSP